MRLAPMTMPTLRALSLILFAFAMSDTVRADILSESFDASSGGDLEIDTDIGAIRIQTHDAARVDVEVERGGSEGERLEVDFTSSGNKVTIEGRWEDGKRNWWGGNKAKVVFNVTVPRNFNVDLRTRGGSIGVDDMNGKVRATTSGGALRFGRIEGEIDANTSGGSIRVDGGGADIDVRTSGGSITIGEATGDVEARTSGGSIRVKNASGRVNARTSGGSVEATMLVQPAGDSSLTTSGGSVRLYVADGVGLEIDASSSSGVRSEIPVGGQTRGDRRLRGPIHGGGPRIRLETNGGGVKIYRADSN
ncbi:MAG: DUF4097 family beta strand repeat-containing protein [Pseudomonadota bacterium]